MKNVIINNLMIGFLIKVCTTPFKNIATWNLNVTAKTYILVDFLSAVIGKPSLTEQHNFAITGNKPAENAYDNTKQYP